MSVSLDKVGDVKLQARRPRRRARRLSGKPRHRRKLAAPDPGNAQAQRDVSVSLNKLGDVKLQRGDRPARSPPIRRASTSAASSRRRTRQRAGAARRVGEPRQGRRREAAGGRRAGALAAYQESLDIRRKLAAAGTQATRRHSATCR